MKVAKWTDWFNLLERRGDWEHWMNSAGPHQVRHGFWLYTEAGRNGMIGFMSRDGDQVFTLPFN